MSARCSKLRARPVAAARINGRQNQTGRNRLPLYRQADAAQGRCAADHRQGPVHRRLHSRRAKPMRRWCARRIRMRASSRSTPRAAKAMPGVLGVFTGADCAADKLEPIPHDPVPKTKYDMKLHRARRQRGVHRAAHAVAGRQGAPCRRSRGHGGGADARRRRWMRPRRSRCDTRSCRSSLHSEDAMRPGAPALWDEVPDNIMVETCFGDRRGDRPGVCARRACGDEEFPYRPRHRRAAGAACRARPTTMPRPAATRSMPAPAARCGRRTS